jgi:hypothetical protein
MTRSLSQTLQRAGALLLLGIGLMLGSAAAQADPPYRVARLSYETGGVSFSPAGEQDWSRAAINRPLITGDRLWVDAESRAELQLDGAALRIGDRTSLQMLNIDDRIAQLQLTQGELEVRIWRMEQDQSFEIDTPNLAYVIRRPGTYRIDVDEKYGSTAVTVRSGEATVYGEGNAFRVTPGETWEFFDTALRDYDTYRPEPPDDLARFAADRDRRWESSVSARYVSRELIGFEELDANGTWQQTPDYGWVWFPTRVAAGWAPYRDGHWAWVEPWGWTWIDDAPWGFAPSHYGRWAFFRERWCWVPGPVTVRPVYAPALVAFVGGSGLSVSIGIGGGGAVGWFPLGPREVYRPAYTVSRDYFTRVNTTNTTVNVTQVTNIYETRNVTNVVYRNQHVPGAVIAVPAAAFTQSRPVAREALRVRAENVQPQAVMAAAPVVPAKQSVLGAQPAASRRPPEAAFRKQVVAQTQPPAPQAPIESRMSALRERPGHPAPETPRARGAAAAAAAPAPEVKVMPAAPAAATAPPPRAPEANRAERRGGGPGGRREAQAPAPAAPTPAAPPPAAAPVAPPAAAPAPAPAPNVPPGLERRREEERTRAEERQQERQQRQQERQQERQGERPAVPQPQPRAVAPTPPAPPAPPAPTPTPPAVPQPAPAPQPPVARPAEPAVAPQQRREEQRQLREERQHQREEQRQQREPVREAPRAAPVPPQPAPQVAPQAVPQPAAPPQPARPQPAPPPVAPRPPEAAPPAVQQQQRREERQEQRQEQRQQRAEERRQAASERRQQQER